MMAFGVTVYLRVRRHWISVRVLPRRSEAAQAEGVARVAVRRNRQGIQEIIACGDEVSHLAEEQDVTVCDASCHLRVLIAGFDKAQPVVGEFLRRACGGKRLLLRFRMVIHLLDELEGGLTDVEERAFQELGLRLGASRVLVYQGAAELSDEQVVALGRGDTFEDATG